MRRFPRPFRVYLLNGKGGKASTRKERLTAVTSGDASASSRGTGTSVLLKIRVGDAACTTRRWAASVLPFDNGSRCEGREGEDEGSDRKLHFSSRTWKES